MIAPQSRRDFLKASALSDATRAAAVWQRAAVFTAPARRNSDVEAAGDSFRRNARYHYQALSLREQGQGAKADVIVRELALDQL